VIHSRADCFETFRVCLLARRMPLTRSLGVDSPSLRAHQCSCAHVSAVRMGLDTTAWGESVRVFARESPCVCLHVQTWGGGAWLQETFERDVAHEKLPDWVLREALDAVIKVWYWAVACPRGPPPFLLGNPAPSATPKG
jgi:hypothetical protein